MFNESKWLDVSCVGENSKQQLVGRFKLKPFLTHKERGDASRLAETYCRGIVMDTNQLYFQRILAYLKFYIVESDADWWIDDGLGCVDETPVYELYKQLRKLQGHDEEEEEKPTDEVDDKPSKKKKSE